MIYEMIYRLVCRTIYRTIEITLFSGFYLLFNVTKGVGTYIFFRNKKENKIEGLKDLKFIKIKSDLELKELMSDVSEKIEKQLAILTELQQNESDFKNKLRDDIKNEIREELKIELKEEVKEELLKEAIKDEFIKI